MMAIMSQISVLTLHLATDTVIITSHIMVIMIIGTVIIRIVITDIITDMAIITMATTHIITDMAIIVITIIDIIHNHVVKDIMQVAHWVEIETTTNHIIKPIVVDMLMHQRQLKSLHITHTLKLPPTQDLRQT